MSKTEPVAVVTGAARGIGAATARLFNQNGYRVALVDILPEVNELAAELSASGPECLGLVCDVSDESAVKSAVTQTLAAFGTIDVLVNNAGVVLVAAVEDINYERFKQVFNINVGGTFLFCKYVLPVLKAKREGAIVNMASVSAHVGQIDHSTYGATKGAIMAFSRALAWEVANDNIRVNSISPGSVDTPMLRGDIEIESGKTGLPFEQVKTLREAEQAFKRWADPMEIAEVIYFLASSKASFMTGVDVLVDCGWVAK
ncbi:MAG: SDR family oxidoreductase [Anaerolineae bacterium]|nr:SDR family oxidoreductase [Anaerolineae bacterium]